MQNIYKIGLCIWPISWDEMPRMPLGQNAGWHDVWTRINMNVAWFLAIITYMSKQSL